MTLSGLSKTVRDRIEANSANLGEIKQVLDRDEDPDIIASNAAMLPTCCVIPIGEGKLNAVFSMGSPDLQEDFQQHVVVYYQFSKDNKVPYDDIDVIRQYAKTLINLFSSRTTCAFNNGVVWKATAEFKPYQGIDYILNRMLITLFVKMIEV
jgi:hypothetical protein